MKLLSYTLNSISLLAITLVIGILVDDAIVEIENIETHIHQGKRPFQAALDVLMPLVGRRWRLRQVSWQCFAREFY